MVAERLFLAKEETITSRTEQISSKIPQLLADKEYHEAGDAIERTKELVEEAKALEAMRTKFFTDLIRFGGDMPIDVFLALLEQDKKNAATESTVETPSVVVNPESPSDPNIPLADDFPKSLEGEVAPEDPNNTDFTDDQDELAYAYFAINEQRTNFKNLTHDDVARVAYGIRIEGATDNLDEIVEKAIADEKNQRAQVIRKLYYSWDLPREEDIKISEFLAIMKVLPEYRSLPKEQIELIINRSIAFEELNPLPTPSFEHAVLDTTTDKPTLKEYIPDELRLTQRDIYALAKRILDLVPENEKLLKDLGIKLILDDYTYLSNILEEGNQDGSQLLDEQTQNELGTKLNKFIANKDRGFIVNLANGNGAYILRRLSKLSSEEDVKLFLGL